MSMNLCVDNGKREKGRRSFDLEQTPTDVTYAILKHPTTARYAAYCEWLRGRYTEPAWVNQPWNTAPYEGKPEWIEIHLENLGEFLRANPNANFYDA